MQTSGSILYSTATRLQIDLSKTTEIRKLRVYKQAMELMIDMLYETSLRSIKRLAVEMLESDIREIIAGLRKINQNGVSEIRTYLGQAQVKADLALSMFDRKEEEISKTRLENRYGALLELRTNLENALDFLIPLVK